VPSFLPLILGQIHIRVRLTIDFYPTDQDRRLHQRPEEHHRRRDIVTPTGHQEGSVQFQGAEPFMRGSLVASQDGRTTGGCTLCTVPIDIASDNG
jgi:hypothetical protein